MICNKLYTSILAFFLLTSTFAQTNISGIINSYAKVTDLDTCKTFLQVSSTVGFKKGEKILLVQMKGAIINEGQSGTFGNLVNLKSAGLYEINTVDSIFNSQIFLKYKFVNAYQTTGSLQIVNIPTYKDVVVTDTLKAKKWDGNIGGILILNVENNLSINAPIDVSNAGFRGGISNPNNDPTNGCTWLLTVSDYYVPKNNWRGAEKGEGIAATIAGKENGRGAQLTGGGGGNDHNSGGGGGGNFSKGGIGGFMVEGSTFGCQGPNPGIGAKGILGTTKRLIMGGGGGAGHGNNGQASSGGNGGGIAFIMAKKVLGSGTKIIANGGNALTKFGDGMGGGGAGGTVVFDIVDVVGNLTIQTNGGIGGTVKDAGSSQCHGPGGGGGGGRIIRTTNLNFNAEFLGGKNGLNENSGCKGASNGALAGENGSSEIEQFLVEAKNESVLAAFVNLPDSAFICAGKTTSILVKAQGVGLNYSWVMYDGLSEKKLNNGIAFDGTATNNLLIVNSTGINDSYYFKCIITSICGDKIVSKPIYAKVKSQPFANFSFQKTGGFYTFKNNSTGGVSYVWDFGDGTISKEKNPQHLFNQDGIFTVNLQVNGDCGVAIFEEKITIVTPPVANFKADTLTGCVPLKVKFKNLSSANITTYNWVFDGGNIQSSTQKEPTVTYLKAGIYNVTLEVANTVFKDAAVKSAYIVVNDVPTADFNVKTQNDRTISFENLSNNADSYFWEFGDGSSSILKEPTKTYLKDGDFNVKITVTNACGSTVYTKKIPVYTLPIASFSSDVKNGCAPLKVKFSDLTAQNVSTRKWFFTGAKIDTSSLLNPTVTYEKAGLFPVKLFVKNSSGKDSLTSLNYIVVTDKPEVKFEIVADKLKISSDNQSNNAVSYLWNIGSLPFSSKDKNFDFTFTKGGDYKVKLAATNLCGTNILEKTLTISNTLECEKLEANFAPNPANYYSQIQFNGARKNPMSYILTTIDGKILQSGEFSKEILVKEFELDNLSSGMYILYFKCENTVFSKKLIRAQGE